MAIPCEKIFWPVHIRDNSFGPIKKYFGPFTLGITLWLDQKNILAQKFTLGITLIGLPIKTFFDRAQKLSLMSERAKIFFDGVRLLALSKKCFGPFTLGITLWPDQKNILARSSLFLIGPKVIPLLGITNVGPIRSFLIEPKVIPNVNGPKHFFDGAKELSLIRTGQNIFWIGPTA